LTVKHPRQPIGHSLLGDVAMARGQAGAAVGFYRRAHEISPNSGTLARLFDSLERQGDGKAARQLAEAWLKSRPRDNDVRGMLANAYARAGDFQSARSTFEAILKLAPNNAEALNNLANVLLKLKDRSALGIAERAVAASPGNADAIDTLGWAHFVLGQQDRALALLRDARLRAPANPEIRYHLAVVLAKSGRKTEAREELEFALKGQAAFESADAAKALLQSLL
jgi:cellulose synthase operon protein C